MRVTRHIVAALTAAVVAAACTDQTAPTEPVAEPLFAKGADDGYGCAAQYPDAVTWYVKAGANPSGATGDINRPFASLADAETASDPGDAIIVLHVPADRDPLEGGITLQECQKLLGTGPPVTTAAISAARSKITNSSGDAVSLANYNKVARIHIENPGGHGIFGINATGANIHDNLITGWNQLEIVGDIFGSDFGRPAIVLAADADATTYNVIRHNVMRDGSSTAILVGTRGSAEATALASGNLIHDIDGSAFLRGGRNPGLATASFDWSTMNVVVSNTAVDNVANNSDGILSVASGGRVNLVVRSFTHRDTKRVGSTSSNGVEIITVPGAQTTLLMEHSDISQAGSAGVSFFNLFGNPGSDILDLGGGALGSTGQNAIFDNGRSGDRLNVLVGNADVVAENNWWGSSDGLDLNCSFPVAPEGSSCALVLGTSSFDFEPFLADDPRPRSTR